MRKMVLVFVAMVAMLFSGMAMAQTQVTGTAGEEVFIGHGDVANAGGWGKGVSGAFFDAYGPASSGKAGADGLTSGGSFFTPELAISGSQAKVTSGSEASGGFQPPPKAVVTGLAEQADWAALNKTDNNFVFAGNVTRVEYDATLVACPAPNYRGATVGVDGKAGAKGNTQVTLVETPDKVVGTVLTRGSSDGEISRTQSLNNPVIVVCDPKVTGAGDAGIRTTLETSDGKGKAITGASGLGKYGLETPTRAAGSVVLVGAGISEKFTTAQGAKGMQASSYLEVNAATLGH